MLRQLIQDGVHLPGGRTRSKDEIVRQGAQTAQVNDRNGLDLVIACDAGDGERELAGVFDGDRLFGGALVAGPCLHNAIV